MIMDIHNWIMDIRIHNWIADIQYRRELCVSMS